MSRYEPTDADLTFARSFIEWNTIRHGIQRADARRTADGSLLLVELNDLNPYLSLDRTTPQARDQLVAAVAQSLHEILHH